MKFFRNLFDKGTGSFLEMCREFYSYIEYSIKLRFFNYCINFLWSVASIKHHRSVIFYSIIYNLFICVEIFHDAIKLTRFYKKQWTVTDTE